MERTIASYPLKENDLLLTSAHDVDSICQPLKELLGISWFGYVKQYNDNTRIHLDNNPLWAAHFYKSYHRYLAAFALIEKQEYLSGFYLQDYFPSYMQLIIKEARDNFAICNSLVVIEKFAEYQEIYFLGMKSESKQFVNVYLNYQDLIKKFIVYFKKSASRLIETADKNRIALPWQKKPKIFNGDIVNLKEKVDTLQYFLFKQESSKNDDRISLLTKKEYQCLLQMALGKTSKEIARELFVSYRTIENHIANLKDKLGCKRKAELIKLALQIDPHSK